MINRIINSTLFLITAYFIVQITRVFSQFQIINLLGMQRIRMSFFYNNYATPDVQWWTRLKVFMINGIGPVSSLLILFISTILFIKLSKRKFKFNVFLNWMIIVSAGFIIADFISPPFFKSQSNLYIIFRWLYLEEGGGGMYFISLIFLPVIPFVGNLINKPFLKIANTTKWLKKKELRLEFFLLTAIIPFLLLSTVLFGLFYSYINYGIKHAIPNEGMRLLTIFGILFFGGIFIFNKDYVSIQKTNDMDKITFSLNLLLITVMVAIFFILWLNLF